MNRAWKELEEANPRLYAVLHFLVENPGAQSLEAAGRLSAQLGEAVTAANARVMLHRARERFAQLLVAEVRRSLGAPSDAELLAELRDLGLLTHCKPALKRPKP